MGTGKTFIATAASHAAGFRSVLVVCPPHLTRKWKREVEETIPYPRTAIVSSIIDLERLRTLTGSGPLFAVMSRERAKLSYRWMPAVIERWAVSKGRLLRDEETGEPFKVPCCPDCTAQIVDKDGVPLTDEDLNRRVALLRRGRREEEGQRSDRQGRCDGHRYCQSPPTGESRHDSSLPWCGSPGRPDA